jgi:hypothetical protein
MNFIRLCSRIQEHANNILDTNSLKSLTKDTFRIRGSIRAYLEYYSDYMNPTCLMKWKSQKKYWKKYSINKAGATRCRMNGITGGIYNGAVERPRMGIFEGEIWVYRFI